MFLSINKEQEPRISMRQSSQGLQMNPGQCSHQEKVEKSNSGGLSFQPAKNQGIEQENERTIKW